MFLGTAAEYIAIDGHWGFLTGAAKLNEPAFDYVKKNGAQALINKIKGEESKTIKTLSSETNSMLKDMGKQAQSSAQKCFDDLIEETRQIRKDFLSRQWKEEPVNKSELAKFWKQIENLSYLYSIWERWKHNETLYAKAIEFKRLGKIAKKFGIEAGPTDFRKETADASRLSQIGFLANNRPDADAVLRGLTEKIWKVIPEKMRTAATEYTRGSGRFNRTLNGYGWDWNAFPIGIEAAKKLVGKANVDNIEYLDMLMEASRMQQDMRVVRGAGKE